MYFIWFKKIKQLNLYKLIIDSFPLISKKILILIQLKKVFWKLFKPINLMQHLTCIASKTNINLIVY
jgi:hypothetical protein